MESLGKMGVKLERVFESQAGFGVLALFVQRFPFIEELHPLLFRPAASSEQQAVSGKQCEQNYKSSGFHDKTLLGKG
jgi:hypothetical protein